MEEEGRWHIAAQLILSPTRETTEEYTPAKFDYSGEEMQSLCHKVALLLAERSGGTEVVDTARGQMLDIRLVKEARQLEIVCFDEKRVYTKRLIREAQEKTGRQPIGVRWVDVSKGERRSELQE